MLKDKENKILPINVEKMDINMVINFIHGHKNKEDIQKAEKFFTDKLKSTTSHEQKSEYTYHLLRSKLMKHMVFETLECKNLYQKMFGYFKEVEQKVVKDYKEDKNEITKSEVDIFYVTVEHYFGSLKIEYDKKNFTDAANRAYVDEMNFRRDKYKLKRDYLKYISYSVFDMTSRYGISMGRWLLTTLITMMIFAIAFYLLDLWHIPMERMVDLYNGGDFFDYIYYSVVTFTTLGYGDISPVSTMGELLAITEVSVGYLMLGMLVSLLGKKL